MRNHAAGGERSGADQSVATTTIAEVRARPRRIHPGRGLRRARTDRRS